MDRGQYSKVLGMVVPSCMESIKVECSIGCCLEDVQAGGRKNFQSWILAFCRSARFVKSYGTIVTDDPFAVFTW